MLDSRDICFSILSNLGYGVFYISTNYEILFWNAEAERITGYTQVDMLHRNCDILQHQDKDGIAICGERCLMMEVMSSQKQGGVRAYLVHKDGHRVPVFIQAFPIVEGHKTQGALQVFTDDAHKKFASHPFTKLLKIANTDALTGLLNRRSMEFKIKRQLCHAVPPNEPFGILFLDVDNFKQINDQHGHYIGDAVLIKLAQLFRKAVSYCGQIGRWGGEEFVGICQGERANELLDVASDIHSMLRDTDFFTAEGCVFPVTISIGATLVQANDSMESLIARADALMYIGKGNGKNCTVADCGGSIKIIPA